MPVAELGCEGIFQLVLAANGNKTNFQDIASGTTTTALSAAKASLAKRIPCSAHGARQGYITPAGCPSSGAERVHAWYNDFEFTQTTALAVVQTTGAQSTSLCLDWRQRRGIRSPGTRSLQAFCGGLRGTFRWHGPLRLSLEGVMVVKVSECLKREIAGAMLCTPPISVQCW